jgi:DNA-binding HxlR family transcriptional regulator
MVHYNGKEFICLLDFTMEFIRGKWKSHLLCHLDEICE